MKNKLWKTSKKNLNCCFKLFLHCQRPYELGWTVILKVKVDINLGFNLILPIICQAYAHIGKFEIQLCVLLLQIAHLSVHDISWASLLCYLPSSLSPLTKIKLPFPSLIIALFSSTTCQIKNYLISKQKSSHIQEVVWIAYIWNIINLT